MTLAKPAGFPFWAKLDIAAAEGKIENDDGQPPGPGGGGGGGGGNDEGDGEDDGGGGGGGGGIVRPPTAAITVSAECAEDLCRARTGILVTFEDASSGTVRSRLWEFGDGGRSRNRQIDHAWSEPGFYSVMLTVTDGTNESLASLSFLVEASNPAGTCRADAETLCLQDSRYSVIVDWWDGAEKSGRGSVVHAGTNDSGLFRFFDRENWEVLIKVLDGCALNGHVWVFGASTTTLGYSIRMTDTVTGAEKEYRNEPGLAAPAITDGTAFPEGCQQ